MSARATNNLKALDVGRYFIYLANRDKKPITNKKLQKLVYYAQAWALVLNDKKLFSDRIEAWVHGPAVRSLYVEYKNFGFSPITEKIEETAIGNISGDAKEVLDKVWGLYGKLDAGYLEMLTHSEAPWREARAGLNGDENSKNIISLKSMKAFYAEKLAQAGKKK